MEFYVVSLLALLGGCVLVFYVVFLRAAILNAKLLRYLKENDYQKWRWMRSFGDCKLVGSSNIDKLRTYLKGNDGEGDLNILKMKDGLRFCIRLFKVIGGCIVLNIIFLYFITHR